MLWMLSVNPASVPSIICCLHVHFLGNYHLEEGLHFWLVIFLAFVTFLSAQKPSSRRNDGFFQETGWEKSFWVADEILVASLLSPGAESQAGVGKISDEEEIC